ncbi:protein containing von Willebrand factor type A (vWA) domain [Saccharomonospora marina XMU15]|uniref:Protein containing von Willebrand factor type A (VWA) domain n=1 Tax=Saccharomonospora marina XMU15 TaxID=882083 RepID=H5X5E7_9PSEU|nr:VWA domain-containing protein [Saccharomonospora marina]EHR50019.1 protein containing von Willebrand factor type A (vWA) domain [Saccharomonospora marina XMU15]
MTTSADPLPGLVGFTAALREAGLPCDAHRVQAYLAAVERLDVADPGQLYWAGRLSLCADPDDLPRYDQAFASWFSTEPPVRQRRSSQPPKQPRIAALATEQGGGSSDKQSAEQLSVAASDTEVLRDRDLGELTNAERKHLRELLETLRPVPPRRSSLRYRPAKRGRLDPSRTLRAMLARGGEPGKLAYSRHGPRPRRVVLLIDVSGSMKPYADSLLRFAHVVVRGSPATVEVFTLGTRLTRVTRQLRQRDPERAMLSAGEAVPDFAGGTRLGDTLRIFLDRWGQRGLARRAAVVLFSDGWERGDTTLLGEQTARLKRLAHAVFWVNPHAGKDGYAPVQSGIAAALPHVDRLLAGHSLATLERLLGEIRDA